MRDSLIDGAAPGRLFGDAVERRVERGPSPDERHRHMDSLWPVRAEQAVHFALPGALGAPRKSRWCLPHLNHVPVLFQTNVSHVRLVLQSPCAWSDFEARLGASQKSARIMCFSAPDICDMRTTRLGQGRLVGANFRIFAPNVWRVAQCVWLPLMKNVHEAPTRSKAALRFIAAARALPSAPRNENGCQGIKMADMADSCLSAFRNAKAKSGRCLVQSRRQRNGRAGPS